MADDIYTVDELVTGTATVTLNDDGTGNDTLRIAGVYGTVVEITLAWTTDTGIPTSAESLYFNPTGVGHRLVVNGVIENAIGSDGQDFIQGNALQNVIFGDALATGAGLGDTLWAGAGNDTVHGGSGSDEIAGDGDDDLLFGDNGSDTISGGAGRDTIEGGAGADVLSGGAEAGDTASYRSSSAGVTIDITFGTSTIGLGGDAQGDTLTGFRGVKGSAFDDVISDTVLGEVAFGGNDNHFDGGAGNDLLTLGGGLDTAYGGDDRDTLDGGGQNDRLFGGAGRDSLFGGSDDDRLDGGAGGDTMTGGLGNDTFVADVNTDIVVEALNEGTDLIVSSVNWTLGAMLEDLTLAGTATQGNGNSKANRLTGNALANTLSGGAGDDTVHGGGGGDSLIGGAGNDLLYGDTGNDTAAGGLGDDTYVTDSSADIITEAVGEGHDRVLSAVSWILGSTLEDLTLTGTATQGGGNSQANQVTGNAVANTLSGGAGDDTVAGLAGNDSLSGGGGDDLLTGGRGVDTVTGLTGADRFIFAALTDLSGPPGPFDTITDFHAFEGDKIDLSGIDAKTGTGNQAFFTIGAAAFSGVKGELRIIASGANLLVSGDVNGDAAADFTILVLNVTGLADSDFSL